MAYNHHSCHRTVISAQSQKRASRFTTWGPGKLSSSIQLQLVLKIFNKTGIKEEDEKEKTAVIISSLKSKFQQYKCRKE